MVAEYRKLAEICEGVDYSDRVVVEMCHRASDRMREIVAEAEQNGTLNGLLPLLDEAPANRWLAHHLVEMGSIDAATLDRCFEIANELAVNFESRRMDAESMGEFYWIREWRAKRAAG